MQQRGPIETWIINDTGFPKQGAHSVGVQHQYCGQLGKEANCQVAVSLSIANHSASLPVVYRVYLPKDWTDDNARPGQGRCAIRYRLQDQAGDRTRSDTVGVRSRPATRGGIDGRRLWS